MERNSYNINRIPWNKACAAVFAQNESGDIFCIYTAQVGKHFIEAGGVQKSTGTDQKISGVVEFLLCNISKNVQWQNGGKW